MFRILQYIPEFKDVYKFVTSDLIFWNGPSEVNRLRLNLLLVSQPSLTKLVFIRNNIIHDKFFFHHGRLGKNPSSRWDLNPRPSVI